MWGGGLRLHGVVQEKKWPAKYRDWPYAVFATGLLKMKGGERPVTERGSTIIGITKRCSGEARLGETRLPRGQREGIDAVKITAECRVPSGV